MGSGWLFILCSLSHKVNLCYPRHCNCFNPFSFGCPFIVPGIKSSRSYPLRVMAELVLLLISRKHDTTDQLLV